jgi:hypothetical protein
MTFSRACEVQMPCKSDISRVREIFDHFSPIFSRGEIYKKFVNREG